MNDSIPTAAEIRAAFDAVPAGTVGIEEELMLLDPETFELVPRAADVIESLRDDPRFKLELPAAQLEIRTEPYQRVGEAIAELRQARSDLAAAAPHVRLAAAGVHPTAPPEGEVNAGDRYEHTVREFGAFARRQLVFALQVHIAPGGADRALAVYNALRSHLPELAALAANAPFQAGVDSGLASARPKIAEALPRQGVPPPLASWDEYADALAWGARAERIPVANAWWWELRPHPRYGTLELRVPDAQTTAAEAAAIAAVCHALVSALGDRFDAGEELATAPSWRIAENRWSACRDGVEGTLADLATGERRPARERLHELLTWLEPVAERLGCAAELASAHELVSENGAIRQRAAAEMGGIHRIPEWLAGRFLA
jgi:carboxylate-amine ligase